MAENPGADIQSVNTLLDSTLDSVETAEDAVLKVAGEIGFPEDDLHQIGMSVRESMVNAVVHGNRYNARKKVHVTVLSSPGRFEIKIADQGEGFDLEQLPDCLEEENLLRNSGRGIFLMKAFMDEVQVRRGAPAGTE